MINSVVVTVMETEESITLELVNPEESGFQVLGIDGLGPPKANINVVEIPTLDGAIFNSARVVARNILLHLKFMEKPTIQAIRRLSYRYFPNKQQVNVAIHTDDRVFQTLGYVEDNNVNIFGQEEEKTTISIICPSPYFYSEGITTTLFSGVVPGFEFPFSNESLVSKLIVFGELSMNKEQNVYYDGDAENGIKLFAHAIGPVVDPAFYNSRTGEVMKILHSKLTPIVAGGIVAGDDIIINTLKGQKSITHIRAGVSKSILNALDQNAAWFSLFYGDNIFRYAATSGEDNLQLKTEHQTIYSGV